MIKEKILDYETLPYRQSVGMMIINKDHTKVFVARRIENNRSKKRIMRQEEFFDEDDFCNSGFYSNRTHKSYNWQMPQGGINLGETPSKAALRELREEIGTDNVQVIAESKLWYKYDVPRNLVPKLWGGAYRGQKQKWFLFEYLGEDADINLDTDHPEFQQWCWIPHEKLLSNVIAFKQKLYSAILLEFRNYLV